MNRLLKFAESKIGSGYVWGTQGEILTPELLQKLIKTYGRQNYYFSNTNAEKWMGKQCFDCSGLVVAGLRALKCIPPTADYSCDGLYRLCTPIAKKDLKPGDLLFIGTPQDWTHVGIYAGNGETVEAMSTSKGVVRGTASRYNGYARLKYDLEEKTLDELIQKFTTRPEDWKEAIDVAVNAAKAPGNLGTLEIFKFIPELLLKIYYARPQYGNRVRKTWKELISENTDSPVEWITAIDVVVNAAKADGNLGVLEIFKFFPDLIEKIYNDN